MSSDEKARYGKIWQVYDTTRRADPYIAARLSHHLALTSGRYLDIACGSGNYTIAVHKSGIETWGVDIDATMLDNAIKKDDAVSWCRGDVHSLPFKDGRFSGVTSINGLHYFEGLERVFSEVYRVLDNGRFVVFTGTAEQMQNYWLNEYFPGMMVWSIKQMPSSNKITGALKSAGFSRIELEPYDISVDLKDFFLYSGNHRPEMYLSPAVRRGISSFTVLANDREVALGCKQLGEDIKSGKIEDIITEYGVRGGGDYMFFTAEK